MMRFFVLSLVIIGLVAFEPGRLGAQARTPSQGTMVSGSVLSPICSSDIFATGEASGEVSGSFSVAFDCQDGSIVGGTWLMNVTAGDGETHVLGTVQGRVLRGAFDVDSDQRIVVRDVALVVIGGTGQYSAIAERTGSLEATVDPARTPQFVGALGLTFRN